ncbi:hypothetical protein WCD74_01275 [Actinomycetospora sp. OC33-EN08]|uniref:Uncharacterized protein n=1 Tax=Actinomycetospora aurantiaca TaxID=3129233 RepID=A0ABU8MGC4_9PSEU
MPADHTGPETSAPSTELPPPSSDARSVQTEPRAEQPEQDVQTVSGWRKVAFCGAALLAGFRGIGGDAPIQEHDSPEPRLQPTELTIRAAPGPRIEQPGEDADGFPEIVLGVADEAGKAVGGIGTQGAEQISGHYGRKNEDEEKA